jgi:ABC-2 type transport system permease protein
MRKILLVAKRDFLATVRTPAFLVGLVLAPLLFGGGMLGMTLFKERPDLGTRRVAVVDRTEKFAAAVVRAAEARNRRDAFDKTGRQTGPTYVFETPAPGPDAAAERLALSDRIRRKQLFAFLEITNEPGLKAAYYTNAGGLDLSRQWFSACLNEGVQRVRLVEMGLAEERLRDLMKSVPVDRMDLVSRNARTGQVEPARKKSELEGLATPFTLVMLISMVVLMGATPMLSAVVEDKSQRVFEMLLGCVSPEELMVGKVISSVARSLVSSAFYIVVALVSFQAMQMLGLMPFHVLGWFLVYLVADVVMLSALSAALGAACSSPHDAQHLAIVVTGPVIVPLMIIAPILKQPNGPVATVMSLLPPFTPQLMLARQVMPGGVPAWQPWLGLAGVVVCTFLLTVAAARIFRIGILMQGKTPKLAEIARWAVRG